MRLFIAILCMATAASFTSGYIAHKEAARYLPTEYPQTRNP